MPVKGKWPVQVRMQNRAKGLYQGRHAGVTKLLQSPPPARQFNGHNLNRRRQRFGPAPINRRCPAGIRKTKESQLNLPAGKDIPEPMICRIHDGPISSFTSNPEKDKAWLIQVLLAWAKRLSLCSSPEGYVF